jgi:ABC-type glycerol-3-phosphate transport system substrate-binding protein
LDAAWTWAEAREVFLELQAKEREARGNDQFWACYIGQGGRLGAGTYTGEMLIRSNGEPGSPTFMAVSEDGLTTDGYINTPEAIEALQFLQDLYVKDELIPSSESPDFFYNEQVGFWLSTPVYLNVFKERNPDLEWGVAPCPYHKTPIVHTDSFHFGVSAFSDDGQAAAELVAYMASPEGSFSMAKAQGVIPQRFSVLEQFPEFEEEPMRIFIDTVREWAYPRPITPGYSEYDAVYEPMLADIATGAPVEDTVNAAAEEIDAQLEKYRALMG